MKPLFLVRGPYPNTIFLSKKYSAQLIYFSYHLIKNRWDSFREVLFFELREPKEANMTVGKNFITITARFAMG